MANTSSWLIQCSFSTPFFLAVFYYRSGKNSLLPQTPLQLDVTIWYTSSYWHLSESQLVGLWENFCFPDKGNRCGTHSPSFLFWMQHYCCLKYRPESLRFSSHLGTRQAWRKGQENFRIFSPNITETLKWCQKLLYSSCF